MRIGLVIAAVAAAAAAMAQSGIPLPAAGQVALPLDEYNRLLEAAGKPPKKPETPPLAYTIQSADLKLDVQGERVTGTIQLAGEVMHKGQLKVPLVSGMTILDARQNGRPLPLDQANGTHLAVLAGPGGFSLALDAGLPLSVEPGRAAISLRVPAAGAARLTLTVPGEFTLVGINPGLITDRGSNHGRTTVQAILEPGKPANIWWASRTAVPAAPAPPKETRFLSDVKTLVSVTESDITLASLADITVVQGEPDRFDLEIPAGYELTGATGATLLASDVRDGAAILRVNSAGARSHQFLVTMARPLAGAKADLALPAFPNSQRETGEVLVEGEGVIELSAAERGGLRRMDVREGSAQLRLLAANPVHAAFRYLKKPAEAPGLALEWTRFPETQVISAVAQQAVVTTLVTSEGRSLTEVKLTVRNQAQPFLRVALPAGADILTAEVEGVKVKPVKGADGDRVPLLRQGFRPQGPYTVSFVFLHSGAPFARKGGSELSLPRMDLPVGLVAWEVFLPKQYRVADFGGDAIQARFMPVSPDSEADLGLNRLPEFSKLELAPGVFSGRYDIDALTAGQIGGYIVDSQGAVIPNATVTITHAGGTQHVSTDASGRWLVAGVPAGRVHIQVNAQGFRALARDVEYDAARPGRFSFRLDVGVVSETVEVTASSATITKESAQIEKQARQNAAAKDVEASANVADLQKRVAGVLPIAVNVPHAGNSYRFVRPLVLDEETRLTFTYRAGK
jgi:hypothetical protein